jgi:hypothetical protein
MRTALLALAALLAAPLAAPLARAADKLPSLSAAGYVEEQASAGALRLTIRRPRAAADFYGSVVLEPVAGPAAAGWQAAGAALMAHGDVWVGVAGPADQLAEAARLLRDGQASPLAAPGLLARAGGLQGVLKIYALGWGPAACGLADFLADGKSGQARRADGRPLINGYVLGGCAAAPALAAPPGAALVRIASEADYPAAAAARRPDSDAAAAGWRRWYDVQAAGRCGGPDALLRTSLAGLDSWLRTGVPAPAGRLFQLGADGRPRPGAPGGMDEACGQDAAQADRQRGTLETARKPQL